jgi:hypothetical protein
MDDEETRSIARLPLPPVPEKRRRIPAPLTDEELSAAPVGQSSIAGSTSERSTSSTSIPPSTEPTVVAQMLAEMQQGDEYHEAFIFVVSTNVSRCWSHLTEGHQRPWASSEDYLTWLVKRIKRERLNWWFRRRDRRIVQTQGVHDQPIATLQPLFN